MVYFSSVAAELLSSDGAWPRSALTQERARLGPRARFTLQDAESVPRLILCLFPGVLAHQISFLSGRASLSGDT